MANSFGTEGTLQVGSSKYKMHRLASLAGGAGLPFSLKILLENLLRYEDDRSVKREDVEALLKWDPKGEPDREIAFRPARVLLQDFTGVPCIVDLAAMRDAITRLGGDAQRINPLVPMDLVIDHSVQVDSFASPQSYGLNVMLEYERNKERYALLRWGQQAFRRFRVVPPGMGICHQVNLEYLAQVVFRGDGGFVYPDTLVGTDSHTTMINSLGVLGWGVGGIEAEAAMLGQPVSMLIPQVVGFKLSGELREGATATDLVLTVTADAAQKGRGRQVRRVLRPRRRRAGAARSRDHRQHGARVRRDHGLLPRRPGDARLPRVLGARSGAGRAGRGLLQGAGAVPQRRAPPSRSSPTRSSSTSAPSSPRSPGPSARRIACRCPG